MMNRKAPLLKIFLGSFFIQSAWSFEKMQGLGFAAAISPALNSICRGKEARRAALKRHLAFYNAHPYMASPVLGAAARLEEKIAEGEAPAQSAVEFKKRVMGPYGAIGDSFFWGSIRPLASCIGIFSAVLWGIWGALVFLAFYNVFHLWMRWMGLKKGYELGEGVVGYIKSLEMPRWGQRARYLACFFLGLIPAVIVYKAFLLPASGAGYMAPAILIGLPAAAASVFVLMLFFKKGLTVSRLIYLVALPLILYGVIGF